MFKKLVALGLAVTVLLATTACGEEESKDLGSATTTASAIVTQTNKTETDTTNAGTVTTTETQEPSQETQSTTVLTTVHTTTTPTEVSSTTTAVVTKATAGQTGTTKTTTKTITTTTAPKTDLAVLDIPFDNLYHSEAGILCDERDGKCGATDLTGKIIIPFEFDDMWAPSPDGYVLAKKLKRQWEEDGESLSDWDEYLYDATGKVVYSTQVRGCLGFYEDEEEYKYSYGTFTGERILFCSNGVVVTQSNYVSFELPTTYTLTLRKSNGTQIKSFDNVTGYSGFSDGKMAISIYYEENNTILVVDTKGNEVSRKEWNGWDIPLVRCWNWTNGIANGFFVTSIAPTPTFCFYSADLQKNYYIGFFDETLSDYYGTFASVETVDGKYVLMDVTKVNPNDEFDHDEAKILKKEYDTLTFRSIFSDKLKFAYINKDDKEGYLSLTDFSEKWYDEAASFFGGKTIVCDGTKTYIINEKFEKISDSIGVYEDVGTLGENLYAITRDGKVYPVIYTP